MSPRKQSSRSGLATAPSVEESVWPAALPSRAELATAFAQALDLAEGRKPGHAARVCYVAMHLAQALDLSPEESHAVFYGALLHDAGATPAAAEFCRLSDLNEEVLFRNDPGRSPQQLALEIAPTNAPAAVDVIRAHTSQGAGVARRLGFSPAVEDAIATHHERWDGHGYPKALKGEAIPLAGRIVAAADLIDSLISAEYNALAARRDLLASLAAHDGQTIDPRIAEEARTLARSDTFWLGLYSENLTTEVLSFCPDSPLEEEARSVGHLRAFAETFAQLAGAKGEHTGTHAARTAELADRLGEALGFSEGRREMLRIAALVHDVGLLGVPARVLAKPDILSLNEMQVMRQHPTFSRMVLEAASGLDEMAEWVGGHHERLDGKGYPEMLEDGTIPLEARILAVVDTYVAVTSERPYRSALSDDDAIEVLQGGSGTQLDPKLVQLFIALPPEVRQAGATRPPRATRGATATSSRTAPRSRRTR